MSSIHHACISAAALLEGGRRLGGYHLGRLPAPLRDRRLYLKR